MIEWDANTPEGMFLKDHWCSLRTLLETEILELGTVEHIYVSPEIAAFLEVTGFDFDQPLGPFRDEGAPILDWNGKFVWCEPFMPRHEIHARTSDGKRFPIITIQNL